jgi:hypothetical protein
MLRQSRAVGRRHTSNHRVSHSIADDAANGHQQNHEDYKPATHGVNDTPLSR